MNKALAIFLLLAGLVAIVRSADVPIMVGNDDAAKTFTFTPEIANAKAGDNIVFTWAGTAKHSIVQTDEAKSCTPSTNLKMLTSGGAFPAPKTITISNVTAGKMWFMCGVEGHCAKGMYGTILVADASGNVPAPAPAAGGAAPSGGAGGAAPSGGAMPSGGAGGASPSGGAGGASPSPSAGGAAPSSANRNYLTSGLLFSSMCMVAAYML